MEDNRLILNSQASKIFLARTSFVEQIQLGQAKRLLGTWEIIGSRTARGSVGRWIGVTYDFSSYRRESREVHLNLQVEYSYSASVDHDLLILGGDKLLGKKFWRIFSFEDSGLVLSDGGYTHTLRRIQPNEH